MRLPALAGLLALAACSRGPGEVATSGGSGSDGTSAFSGSTGASPSGTGVTGTTGAGSTGSSGGTCATCSPTAACPDARDTCVPSGASTGSGVCAAPCGTNDACASGYACQQFLDSLGNPAGSGCVALSGTCPQAAPGGICASCGPGNPCPGQAQCAASGADGFCIDPCASAPGVDACKPGYACQTFSGAFRGCVPNAGTCP